MPNKPYTMMGAKVRAHQLIPFLRLEIATREIISANKPKHRGRITQAEMLNALRITKSAYGDAHRRGQMPRTWDDKMRAMGIDPEWVRTGEGEPFATPGHDRELPAKDAAQPKKTQSRRQPPC